jgi:hypothetical protein
MAVVRESVLQLAALRRSQEDWERVIEALQRDGRIRLRPDRPNRPPDLSAVIALEEDE